MTAGRIQRVAVLGAGNGGCAVAADLALRGFNVRLFNRTEERLRSIRERGGIELTGVSGEGHATLERITTSLEEALEGSQLVVLTVPISALEHYAPRISVLISPEQVLLLNPGHMGGALFVAAEIERRRPGFRASLCETTTLTYACRMQGPASVRIYRVVTDLLCAAYPATNTSRLLDALRPAFPNLRAAANVLETGLQDLNAVEHPAQMVCNAGWVEHTRGDFYFYYEGTTPAVSRVIEAVDAERVALARALGVRTRTFVDYFLQAGYTTSEGARSGRVHDAMQASEANRWIKGPASLDHRYIHEDVGWGLVPWIQLASAVGVPTPVMSALTTLASSLTGIDYMTQGLTLAKLGLGEPVDSARLLRDVTEGRA